ncbi:MAG: putative C-S lyase [Chloroflexi bacterium]|nr:putative C-S lyase [Chloroflexota bacterium]
MHPDFDHCVDRRCTESIKWRRYGHDVLPMWVADMDFPSPEPVIRALRERVDHGVFGYPGEPEGLREVIVARLADRYGWQVSPDDLVFIPGVVTGLNMACQSLAKPGEGVLVQTPVYGPFLSAPANAGLRRDEMELTVGPDGRYAVDVARMRAAILPTTRLFILCNPHNPVGRVFRRDELAAMAEACVERDVTIVSDEIHCDFCFDGHQHVPIASLSPAVAARTITLIAPSKTFNVAGLSCSVAIIPNEELRRAFQRGRRGLVPGVNIMGYVAALAAYRDGQPWLDALLPYLQGNRDYLVQRLTTETRIRVAAPEGTYLAWLDCRGLDLPCPADTYFLENAKVALGGGPGFGHGGEGFLRLNFGCRREMLAEALDRMVGALAADGRA